MWNNNNNNNYNNNYNYNNNKQIWLLRIHMINDSQDFTEGSRIIKSKTNYNIEIT